MCPESVEAALMFNQLNDSLLNSNVVPQYRVELQSLRRVLEMPFGPQQKTPTRLLKHREIDSNNNVVVFFTAMLRLTGNSTCTHCLLDFPISSKSNFHLGRPTRILDVSGWYFSSEMLCKRKVSSFELSLTLDG